MERSLADIATMLGSRDMLRLNPGDNQGVRYTLLALLLEADDRARLAELLERFSDDGMADWCYGRALLAFRRDGDAPAARAALAAARRSNPHVPAFLTGRKRWSGGLPDAVILGVEEAHSGAEPTGPSLPGTRVPRGPQSRRYSRLVNEPHDEFSQPRGDLGAWRRECSRPYRPQPSNCAIPARASAPPSVHGLVSPACAGVPET
jgi:hypothetical protein